MTDKLIKWLVVILILAVLALGGLLAYRYDLWSIISEKLDTRERYTVSPGSPTIAEKSVMMDSTISSSFRRTFYKIDGDKLILNDGTGAKEQKETWILTPKTTATCTDDLFVDANGQQKRRSEMYIQYKYEDMIQPLAENVEWLKVNAKVDQPIMVFGNKDDMIAVTIYLYEDKCP